MLPVNACKGQDTIRYHRCQRTLPTATALPVAANRESNSLLHHPLLRKPSGIGQLRPQRPARLTSPSLASGPPPPYVLMALGCQAYQPPRQRPPRRATVGLHKSTWHDRVYRELVLQKCRITSHYANCLAAFEACLKLHLRICCLLPRPLEASRYQACLPMTRLSPSLPFHRQLSIERAVLPLLPVYVRITAASHPSLHIRTFLGWRKITRQRPLRIIPGDGLQMALGKLFVVRPISPSNFLPFLSK